MSNIEFTANPSEPECRRCQDTGWVGDATKQDSPEPCPDCRPEDTA